MKNHLRIYQLLSIGVIILLIYVLFMKIIPEYIYFFELISEYQETKKQLKEDTQWKERSVALKLDINRIKKKIADINLDIPSEYELYKPLNLLDSLFNKNNISFDKMQYVSVDTVKQYQFVRINVTLRSPFLKLKQLIDQIENSQLIIIVEGIQFQLTSLFSKKIKADLALQILLRRKR